MHTIVIYEFLNTIIFQFQNHITFTSQLDPQIYCDILFLSLKIVSTILYKFENGANFKSYACFTIKELGMIDTWRVSCLLPGICTCFYTVVELSY